MTTRPEGTLCTRPSERNRNPLNLASPLFSRIERHGDQAGLNSLTVTTLLHYLEPIDNITFWSPSILTSSLVIILSSMLITFSVAWIISLWPSFWVRYKYHTIICWSFLGLKVHELKCSTSKYTTAHVDHPSCWLPSKLTGFPVAIHDLKCSTPKYTTAHVDHPSCWLPSKLMVFLWPFMIWNVPHLNIPLPMLITLHADCPQS